SVMPAPAATPPTTKATVAKVFALLALLSSPSTVSLCEIGHRLGSGQMSSACARWLIDRTAKAVPAPSPTTPTPSAARDAARRPRAPLVGEGASVAGP